MKNPKTLAATLLATAVAAVTLVGCSDTDRDRCNTTPVVMFYSVTDHTYHYGSVTGKRVPTSKVPSAARKVPGYKPYNPPKAPAVKAPSVGKPGPAYKAPAAPRMRSGKR
jgi:hypothetical protein